jgi:hypothetical protein
LQQGLVFVVGLSALGVSHLQLQPRLEPVPWEPLLLLLLRPEFWQLPLHALQEASAQQYVSVPQVSFQELLVR